MDRGAEYIFGAVRSEAPSAKAFGAEAFAAPEPDRVRLLMHFEGSLAEAEAIGFEATTIAGDVAAGSIPIDRLDELSQIKSVTFAEAARPMHAELDVSAKQIGATNLHKANPANRGKGVIVGIIDSGIDYTHECFRDANGKSRILAIWDQDLQPFDGESSPAGFNLGVEYTKSDIDAALALPDPFSKVRHQDIDPNGHGTHVAGIAAGNGLASPKSKFVGVAPEADIIVVAVSMNGPIGDSTTALDAVNYLLKKSTELGKPIAINMSQGDNFGPHDGTALLERGIDALLGQPGQAMVKSSGNARADGIHAAGVVKQGKITDITVSVPKDDRFPDKFDIWYSGHDQFEIAIAPPSGAATNFFGIGSTPVFALANGNAAQVDAQGINPFNGDNRIEVTISAGSKPAIEKGDWKLRLRGVTVTDGRFHAWIQRDNVMAKFTGPFASESVTITSPAAAKKVVAVGAYVCKSVPGIDGMVEALASFSSIGPTRDGRAKPELCAPGQMIMSAKASSAGQNDRYHLLAGTSMAAPHVTGAMALLLEKDKTLDCTQLAAKLKASCRKADAFTGKLPNEKWGAGKLKL